MYNCGNNIYLHDVYTIYIYIHIKPTRDLSILSGDPYVPH